MGLKNLEGHNWSLALIGIKEDRSKRDSKSIELMFDPNRRLFTNFHAFVRALTDQGEPELNLFDLNSMESII